MRRRHVSKPRRTASGGRSNPFCWVRCLIPPLFAFIFSGCQQRPPSADPALLGGSDGESSGDGSAGEMVLDPKQPLPNRRTVIARATELALRAAHRDEAALAPELTMRAANLYRRLWRVEHVDSDARSAVELFASAEQRARTTGAVRLGCEAERARAELAGELAVDPQLLYGELYSASQIFDDDGCDALLSAGLELLAAYRPSRGALAALQHQANVRRAGPSGTTDRIGDERGVVVTPRLDTGARTRARIVAVQPYGAEDRARVVITLSAPVTYRVSDAAGPSLVLELDDVELGTTEHAYAVGGLVHRIVGGQGSHPGATRLTLDLATTAFRRIFYLPEPFRIILDLAANAPSSTRARRGAPRAVSRVALDAGHGGVDSGAIGASGLREKDVTLDIAHLAAPVLSRELGVLTVLTRDDDRNVPLDARTARANAFHADLFVSIHCNASENREAAGVMSFVLDASREELAARIAARENAVSLAATSQVASIVADLRLSEVAAHSLQFAELMQRAAVAALAPSARNHGVKTAGFFVLAGAEMPSVLFETSFISNPTEEHRLATPEYRAKLADAIVNAVRAYRDGR